MNGISGRVAGSPSRRPPRAARPRSGTTATRLRSSSLEDEVGEVRARAALAVGRAIAHLPPPGARSAEGNEEQPPRRRRTAINSQFLLVGRVRGR